MRYRASMLAVALTSLAWTSIAAAQPKHPTAEDVAADIRRIGAETVIRRLDETRQLDWIYDQMAEGRAEWIALAPKLEPGTALAAAPAEDLGIALAAGLAKNPQAVLRALSPEGWTISARRVCSVPFTELEAPADFAAYKRRATAALLSVKDPSLAATRDQCLAELRESQWRGG